MTIAGFIEKIVLSVFALRGRAVQGADYLKIYGDFLQYSLGDFLLLSKTRVQTQAVSFSIRWKLDFRRQNGEERVFIFDNRHYEPQNSSFARAVMTEAGIICGDDLKKNVLSAHFAQEEFDAASGAPALVILNMELGEEDPALVLDSQNGLRLCSVTGRELVLRWGAAYSICARAREENSASVIARLKSAAKTLASHLGQGEVYFQFLIAGQSAHKTNFRGVYSRQNDAFDITPLSSSGEKAG